MVAHGHGNEEIPLLAALPLMQKLILSSFNRETFSFTKTQVTIFAVLCSKGSLTMKEVAAYIASSKEQATRAVAPLVDAGYVERYTDPENRTRIHIRLTSAGEAFMEERRAEFRANIARRLDAYITQEERQRLSDSLETVIAILSKVQ